MQIVVVSVFVIFCSAITRTQAIQCYICGPGAEQPFKKTETANGNFDGTSSPNIRGHRYTTTQVSTTRATFSNSINTISKSCNDFDIKSNSRMEFVMECPTRYSGCITEIEGIRTTRTCEMLDVNDCKIANNITYCYCNTDLCNGELVSILTSRAWKYKDPVENYDDEDFPESSGMDENGYHKRKNRIHSTVDNEHKNFATTITINHIFAIWICIFFTCIHSTFQTFYET